MQRAGIEKPRNTQHANSPPESSANPMLSTPFPARNSRTGMRSCRKPNNSVPTPQAKARCPPQSRGRSGSYAACRPQTCCACHHGARSVMQRCTTRRPYQGRKGGTAWQVLRLDGDAHCSRGTDATAAPQAYAWQPRTSVRVARQHSNMQYSDVVKTQCLCFIDKARTEPLLSNRPLTSSGGCTMPNVCLAGCRHAQALLAPTQSPELLQVHLETDTARRVLAITQV